MTEPPDYLTPEQFAKHFGWSARKVREFARQLGACRIIGNRMLLIQDDIDAILEASRPQPAQRQMTSPQQDYQHLVKLRGKMARDKATVRARNLRP